VTARTGCAVIALCAAGLARLPSAQGDGIASEDRGASGSVIVGGSAPEHDRAVVGAAVALAAREAGWALPREPVAKQDADRLFDCSDPGRPWACVPVSIGERGIRRMLVFAVEQSQADNAAPMLVLTARLIVTAPQALVVRQRFCEHCADDRLTDASIDLARQLLQDLAVRIGRTILEVGSTPPGARITLDGRPIGATNAAFNTFPGSHVVVVEKPGYRSQTHSVIAEEGKTCGLEVALVVGDRPAEPRRGSAIAGPLIGGGALAAIAAGILIDLGARGGPHDGNEKYRYAGATPVGAALGLAGAAAIAAGWTLAF
jgi:hypothetical protein